MYKALHMLVGNYVKDRDAENTYDYYYQVDNETTGETTDEAPREARRPPQRRNHRAYYADEIPQDVDDQAVQIYNPNDVVSAGVGLGSSGGITNTKFYSLLGSKVVTTGTARTPAGAGNAEVQIESFYVDEEVEIESAYVDEVVEQ